MHAPYPGIQCLEQTGVCSDRTGQGFYLVFAPEEVIAFLARPLGPDPGDWFEARWSEWSQPKGREGCGFWAMIPKNLRSLPNQEVIYQ